MPIILADQENHHSKPAQANSSPEPILKSPSPKRAGKVAQMVEHLPSKVEALNSSPNTAKEKKKT
jgi:hypothetical protein